MESIISVANAVGKNRQYLVTVVVPYGTTEMLCIVGWEWHDWDHLPDNLFPPLLKLKKSGYNPFNKQSDYSLSCIDMNC